ncbi:hypothetical protein M1146_07620 [Patescibacteria group bacterium]|nr:hypothetical protein [Patescibacteria group bacterium]
MRPQFGTSPTNKTLPPLPQRQPNSFQIRQQQLQQQATQLQQPPQPSVQKQTVTVRANPSPWLRRQQPAQPQPQPQQIEPPTKKQKQFKQQTLSQTASTVKPSAPQIPRKATITEDQILANAQALADSLTKGLNQEKQ